MHCMLTNLSDFKCNPSININHVFQGLDVIIWVQFQLLLSRTHWRRRLCPVLICKDFHLLGYILNALCLCLCVCVVSLYIVLRIALWSVSVHQKTSIPTKTSVPAKSGAVALG